MSMSPRFQHSFSEIRIRSATTDNHRRTRHVLVWYVQIRLPYKFRLQEQTGWWALCFESNQVTIPYARRSVVRISVGAKSSLLQTAQWAPRKIRRLAELHTHLQLVPRLRMGGVIPLLLLYAFMAWTKKTLPSYVLISPTVPVRENESRISHPDRSDLLGGHNLAHAMQTREERRVKPIQSTGARLLYVFHMFLCFPTVSLFVDYTH